MAEISEIINDLPIPARSEKKRRSGNRRTDYGFIDMVPGNARIVNEPFDGMMKRSGEPLSSDPEARRRLGGRVASAIRNFKKSHPEAAEWVFVVRTGFDVDTGFVSATYWRKA